MRPVRISFAPASLKVPAVDHPPPFRSTAADGLTNTAGRPPTFATN